MKKLICAIMALSMILALAACGKEPAETTPPTEAGPGSALEILETIWNAHGEEEKFAVMGGNAANPQDGKPGAFPLDDESITYSLLIPAEQLGNVTEAASMIHMMNANSFTSGVFKLAEGVTAADFSAAMKDAILNNQWMCGFPETLLIQDIAGQYVLVAFGVNDLMNPFITHLNASYPGSTALVQEAIA